MTGGDDPAVVAQPPPEWLAAYLGYLATQRRAAALTLENYRRDLERLQRLADGRAPPTLTSHDIRRFVARMHGEGLGGRSIARVLSAWRGLFRWFIRQLGEMEVNPAEGVRPPKSPQPLPKALSPDQAQALLDADAEDGLDVRDHAMFELMYSSGLRLAELAALDVGPALDLAERMVTVRGKRNKMRAVPVGTQAVAALAAWLAQRDALARGDEPALFVTRSGTRMSSGAIRSRLTRWAQLRGLGVHVHPHMLRHSFASHVLQSSGDLRAVQELLGHASIRSTQVYTHLDFQHLAKVYDAAHPRARRR
ncbi:tyrosine-type recombinase/integrase [Aromatoleum toluolicum]|uniref:Tyrosine recombinase XerC n=1 Tax=Aromatoleum toluolicum TaxID=90060 RepID=A0ABX1NK36_9RHOO|nr:tyrosine-type recombinase/integrase [Aromatoleum toluolicum]NMF99629.1 tyrosine-type recombinase/integrase [Aromatoleum toluolicum]